MHLALNDIELWVKISRTSTRKGGRIRWNGKFQDIDETERRRRDV